MGMFDWNFGARRDQDVPEFARKVAAESRAQVWQQIAVRAGRFGSLPEAQAFIRVRARRAARHQLYRMIDRNGWMSADREQQILERVLVILAGQFVGPLLHVQSAAVPVRHAA
jgi:hypothetical protein